MNDLEKTIKHFESLQKRYTTQHNGKMCERVADALEVLYLYKKFFSSIQDVVYKKLLDTYSKMLAGDIININPPDIHVDEIGDFKPTEDMFDRIITDLRNGRTPRIQSDNTEGFITKI